MFSKQKKTKTNKANTYKNKEKFKFAWQTYQNDTQAMYYKHLYA